MSLDIRAGGLELPEVADLLAEHLRGMLANTPPGSVHALAHEALQREDVSFWTAWNGEQLAGCAALLELSAEHGEIKSMRTAQAHLGKGVASALLAHLIVVALDRGYVRLSLETGSAEAFQPALRLYEKFGFSYCEPFGDYRPDPFSRFMTLSLRR